MARNLKQLLEYEGDDVDDVFGLDFRLTFEEFGALRHVDLVPNGDQVDVTADNRQQYVDLYVEYLLNKSIDKQVMNEVFFCRGVFFFFFFDKQTKISLLRWEKDLNWLSEVLRWDCFGMKK